MAAARQLKKNLRSLDKDPPPGITACPTETNIFEWNALISGPDDTPFEDGLFRLKLHFPVSYPAEPPTVWFYTKMFHPNVYPDGKICLDILQCPEKWDRNYDVAAVLCAIQAMLGDPNPNDPANGEANALFKEDLRSYEARVKEIVRLSNISNEVDEVQDDGNWLNQNQMESDAKLQLDFAMALSLSAENS